MKLTKHLLSCILALCVLFYAAVPAYAADELPDLSRKGSLTVTIRDKEALVSGGSLTLYQVGKIEVSNGDYSYALTEAFAPSGASLKDLESASLAKSLADFAKEKNLSGQTLQIGVDGKAYAGDLPLGVYLVVQKELSDGYAAINPFLVSIPMTEDGKLTYDVNATPKVETEHQPGEDTPPDSPPTTPPGTTPPPGSKLPQTGQLWWPVPILACAGLVFFVIGLVRRRNDQ